MYMVYLLRWNTSISVVMSMSCSMSYQKPQTITSNVGATWSCDDGKDSSQLKLCLPIHTKGSDSVLAKHMGNA